MIEELWTGESQVINTSAFKGQIQHFAPRFMGYSQQDAQEFLRYLLEGKTSVFSLYVYDFQCKLL